mmetsp:Transcript_92712/g.288602  ORF Transcript_92712/g.288602 Transcript_92712/m.288602 type:complete len:259 (-) Transcript_92712:52-828(-)
MLKHMGFSSADRFTRCRVSPSNQASVYVPSPLSCSIVARNQCSFTKFALTTSPGCSDCCGAPSTLAKRSAAPSCCAAARTTSSSPRSRSSANCSARPFCCTAARTTSRSARSSAGACCRARPSCSTAAMTTPRSALSSGAANSSARQSACTARSTTSASALMSCGAPRSCSGSRPALESHSACSGERRSSVRLVVPLLPEHRSFTSASSCSSAAPATIRCSRGGMPHSFFSRTFRFSTVQSQLWPTLSSSAVPSRRAT